MQKQMEVLCWKSGIEKSPTIKIRTKGIFIITLEVVGVEFVIGIGSNYDGAVKWDG